ncbi:MAG: flagellar motor protein MotA [Alphaproteobacteria bacterium]
MNGLRRYLIRMVLFLIVVATLVVVLGAPLTDAFMANPALNGLILGVLVLGIGYIFRQVVAVMHEETWIEGFRTNRPGLSMQEAPRLLAPMAAMLGERKGRFSLSAIALRSVLDGIASRLEESRDLSRYLIGLLIFLGLLGTFWGLLQTISAVGDVIGRLSVGGNGNLGAVFGELQAGLRAPLNGMGTAFSSSLFGLAGSLVLGFLELQAGQAQNRFFNDLEDWLAGQTRLASGIGGVESDQGVPAYVQALLEQTADGLEQLQRTLERGEERRISADSGVVALTEKLSVLTEQMRMEQSLMVKLAESQLEIRPLIAHIAESGMSQPQISAGDDAMRTGIRNIDLHLARLLEEMSTGRTEMVSELRNEIRVLSRTMAAIAERGRQ